MRKNQDFAAKPQHGKRANQKLKPYLVQQYLLKYTDENHVATSYDIISFLEECGIYAERRSIYRDIDEINRVLWMLENEATMEEAEAAIAADECDNEKTVVYDKSRKGFYVRQRHYDVNEIFAFWRSASIQQDLLPRDRLTGL